MSEADRELLLLVAWDGLSPAEAATVLDVKPATARVRLLRARRRLTQALASERSDPTTCPPLSMEASLMTVDSMARLAAANPVLDQPAVESPERLRRLIEDDAPLLDFDERRDGSSPTSKGSRMRRRTLVAVPLCIAASVAGVVLSSGPPAPV